MLGAWVIWVCNVIDSFYVTEPFGKKLTSVACLTQLNCTWHGVCQIILVLRWSPMLKSKLGKQLLPTSHLPDLWHLRALRLLILSNIFIRLKGAMYLRSDGQVGPGFTYRLGVSPLCLTWGFSFTAKILSFCFKPTKPNSTLCLGFVCLSWILENKQEVCLWLLVGL